MLPRLFVALDTINLDTATDLARSFQKLPGVGIKLGMEFYAAHGPQGVRHVAGGLPLFLDLKFHDIPNTVHGAVRAAASHMQPVLMTVHASGGQSMLQAAQSAAAEAIDRPCIVSVSVLTSLDQDDLVSVGLPSDITAQSLRLAALVKSAGLNGLVCSGHELQAIRDLMGPDALLIVPGIRLEGASLDDQKRILTPAEAFKRGATSIVVGRPITRHSDPVGMIKRILYSIDQAELPVTSPI